MQKILDRLQSNDAWLYPLIITALTIAFFLNLDVHHLFVHTDEPRRALVSLEMLLSGDYITPTLNGENYYNKPPLYNWIIIASYLIFDEISEFSLRFPVIVSIALLTLSIYFYSNKHFDRKTSALIALSFATCGRVLFYDSFLGLIDITFSLIVYISFMVIYHEYKAGNLYRLFVFSYSLTAVAFLMKGLPAIVFQGITLFTLFAYERNLRQLICLRHFIGLTIFILIVGAYYLIYFQINEGSYSEVFYRLWYESTKRTGLSFGLDSVVLHILTFPFEFLYHFAPWTFLIVFLFKRGVWQEINAHPFLKYCCYIFIANIIVYWTSPEVFARYLFVFIPLVNTLLFYFFLKSVKRDWRHNTVYLLFAIPILAGIFIALSIPFNERLDNLSFLYTKALALFVGMSLSLYLFMQLKQSRIIILMFGLAIIRIGMDWFNLPLRSIHMAELKEQAIDVAIATEGKPLYILSSTPVHDGTSFYISRQREKILNRRPVVTQEEAFYISSQDKLPQNIDYQQWMVFRTRNFSGDLYLIKIPQDVATTALTVNNR